MSIDNLPPAPDGALIYTHPQGKTIYVLTDGNMICFKPDGKRGTSSATPAKLAAGHGGWELREGSGRASDVVVAPLAADAFGLAPQLAESAEVSTLQTFVTDDRYILEQKVDGDRVLLDTTSGTLVARTRDGRRYTKGLPTAVRNHGLPDGIVIDGELVGTTYWAFDLPVTPLVTGQPMQLHVRRLALEALQEAGLLGPIRVVPQARTMDEKMSLARVALTEGYEGLMAKRVDSVYVPGGRTLDWMKIKFTKTADVVVMPKKKEDGHNSVALGVHRDGLLVEIGHSSLNGKEKREAIAIGDVLEVRYLYVGANGRLFQPTILRKRTDKSPEDCTGGDLVHVNKAVLEALT